MSWWFIVVLAIVVTAGVIALAPPIGAWPA